jgi:DNA-binding CsgD family transcriptional regulator
MSEGRISAPARDHLTPRQREVMELIAAGKTNFEIAQHLGVSLEGAKYHVSEILAKLGVDSREEAVAAWQSGERRWRLPRMRVLVPAAAAIAALAVTAVLLLALLQDDDPTPTGDPEAWLAWVPESIGESSPLHVVRGSDPSAEVRRFDDLYYRLPAWSGDGEHLAAWGFDPELDSSAQLVVFSRDGWDRKQVEFEGNPGRLYWSPDGDVLLHVGPGIVTFYSPDLSVLREVQYPPSSNVPTDRVAAWSPDSEWFVLARYQAFSVVTRDGETSAVELPDEMSSTRYLLGPSPENLYWESETSFVLVMPPAGQDSASLEEHVRWVFERNGDAWKRTEVRPGPGYPESTVPSNGRASGFYQGRSLDGGSSVFSTQRLSAPDDVESEIWVDGEVRQSFVLPVIGGGPSGRGRWYDVVVARD